MHTARINIHFARVNDLVLLAWSGSPHCRQRLDKHLVGYATIQFVRDIEPSLFLAYDEREYNLHGEWFFPAHPGPRLRFHANNNGEWHHRHIGFKGPLWDEWRARGLWLEEPQCAPQGEQWERRFDDLIQWTKRGDKLGRLRAINGIERLLLELLDARSQQNGGDEWLTDFLVKLDAHPTPDFAALAREEGLSDSALRRRFKAATGTSMQNYALEKRIARARALLLDTNWTLRKIASELGYQSEWFFARQFKERVGVAPGTFRRSRLR
ncbi:AraC family transcriptional regulator [bacterium]|nr:MAG: AraC family transcriptional regulator [bacterium]